MSIFKVGKATVTRIEETYGPIYGPGELFPEWTDAHLKEHGHNASLRKLQRESGARGHKYSLWEHHNNALPIFSEGMFMEKVNYIHQNPVRAGLVERVGDYRWSSVRIWKRCPLEDEPLMVDIDRINWRRGEVSR